MRTDYLLGGIIVLIGLWSIYLRFKHPELTETQLFIRMLGGSQ